MFGLFFFFFLSFSGGAGSRGGSGLREPASFWMPKRSRKTHTHKTPTRGPLRGSVRDGTRLIVKTLESGHELAVDVSSDGDSHSYTRRAMSHPKVFDMVTRQGEPASSPYSPSPSRM